MEIEVNQILFQVLNFGLLLFVLTKFLFKPILNILDTRADRVQKGLAAAEKSLKEQEKLEERKAKELAEAEKKASAIISASRAESKKLASEIVAAAKLESQKIADKQEADFMDKLNTLEKTMESRLADMVVATTKKALSDSLSASELKSITSSVTKKLK